MNKGLTNYFKIKRCHVHKDVVIALAIIFLVFSHLAVYAWGRISGWDRAEFFTKKNIETALQGAIEDGRNFRLRNMNVKFFPRADSGVNVAMFRIVNTQAELTEVANSK